MLFCSEVETLFEKEMQLTIWHNQRETVLTWSSHKHLLFKATKNPHQNQNPNQTQPKELDLANPRSLKLAEDTGVIEYVV